MFVAEAVGSSFLGVLIDKLIAPPLLEYARRKKVDTTLEEWKRTLTHIEAVLHDAENKQIREKAVKVWLDDLKSLAYDIEDVVDEFDTEAKQRSLTEGSQASTSKILVVFCGTDEIRKAVIRVIFQQINREGLHRLILVLQSKMNSHARKVVDEYPIKVELFQITELLINITKHVLVPKHEILSAQEKRKLVNKYKLEDKQFPIMQKDDAIARYYGLEKGQVVKITYKGGLTDSLVTYRCVS